MGTMGTDALLMNYRLATAPLPLIIIADFRLIIYP